MPLDQIDLLSRARVKILNVRTKFFVLVALQPALVLEQACLSLVDLGATLELESADQRAQLFCCLLELVSIDRWRDLDLGEFLDQRVIELQSRVIGVNEHLIRGVPFLLSLLLFR